MTMPIAIPGPRVLGVDLSLNSTGLTVIADHLVACSTVVPKATGHRRLELIADAVVARAADADLVLIEAAVSYGKGNNALLMGGAWWVITHALWHEAVEYVVIH